ncbi:hypothetical protein GQ457_06G007970 [Hibiscus cannabinus]
MNPSSIKSLLLFLMLLFVASETSFLLHKHDILFYNDLQAGMNSTSIANQGTSTSASMFLLTRETSSSSSFARTSLGSPCFTGAWNGMERCIGSTFTTITWILKNVNVACGI